MWIFCYTLKKSLSLAKGDLGDWLLEKAQKENLFPQRNKFYPHKESLEFSIEAQADFETGHKLLLSRTGFNDPQKPYNANASLYDIREYFQGVKTDTNGKPTMNPPNKAKDEHCKHLYDTLKTALTKH